ncbi:MAG: glycerophosphodiester phosphodiesterase family protein, partial [Synechococcaceae cyanobacterium]|nr:glycerophosphodiester phosphodiesterase family protein [Synechococcaceae cyanobacterium]
GILYAEQASLMTIACGALGGRRVTYLDALRHAARHAWPLTRLAGHMTVRVLAVCAPFLAAGGLVHARLLTEHDINYYLARRPAEFWEAVAWIGALALPLAAVLARLAVGWLFALPAVLFDDARPRDALRASGEAARGHRRAIALWLAAWALLAFALSLSLTAGVGFLGRRLIPAESLSLPVVAAAIGAVLALNALGNLVVSLLAGALFGLLAVRLHDRYAPASIPRWSRLETSGSLDDPAPRLPGRGRLWAALAAAAAVAGLAVGAVHAVSSHDDVAVAAHRGASRAAPENTLAAFERAVAHGADWVELDVQESADGVVVVAHDRDFMKVSGVAARVWESTHAELASIDVGSWFSPEFADQTVPTLAQALALCKGRAKVLIELKHYGHARRLEERVIELVEAADMAADVRIMSLDHASVLRSKSLRPDWPHGLLVAVAMGDPSRLDVDFLAVGASLATRHLVRSAHRRGKEVFVWTGNDAAQMSALISRGVDGLITDEPARARSVLARRAEMSVVQRLVVDVGVRLGLVDVDGEPSGAADA